MPDASLASVRIDRVPLVVAVSGRFGKYRPEEERDVRKVAVEKDQVLEQLKAAWKRYDCDVCKFLPKELYQIALKQVKGLVYSAKDVEKFSLALAEFQDEEWFSLKAGYFLSALINNGRESEYTIHTRHLGQKIDELGHGNTKNITVNGDVGRTVGHEMKGGTIHVEGDMDGNAGWAMEGGTIILEGNAGPAVRWLMAGGEIHLNGGYKSISKDPDGGKIYHKGKLIWDADTHD